MSKTLYFKQQQKTLTLEAQKCASKVMDWVKTHTASAMLPPKLRHILGCLAFSDFFVSKIKPYPGRITFSKYNGKSIFWLFLNIVRNSSRKKFRIEIWTFSFQICFRNQFLTLESGQTENTQIRVFVYFPLDHFPKSKIDSKSRFEMRMSIFLFYFFLKSFGLYLKK